MAKVVINYCYGGFRISDAGIRRYAEIKGISLYPEKNEYFTTYWTCPPEQRPIKPDPRLGDKACVAYNKAYKCCTISEFDFQRDDPALVQTVEELGEVAGSHHSDLIVVEIPDDVKWLIEEYDGLERVAEQHRTWP